MRTRGDRSPVDSLDRAAPLGPRKPRGYGPIMHITGMVHVNVNCSDFDVSLAFYQRLGSHRAAFDPVGRRRC